jgi:hypothetical protein
MSGPPGPPGIFAFFIPHLDPALSQSLIRALQASPAPGVMTAKMVAMVHQVAVAPQVKWAFQVPVVQLAKSVLPARMAGCMGPLGHLVPLGMTDANAFK